MSDEKNSRDGVVDIETPEETAPSKSVGGDAFDAIDLPDIEDVQLDAGYCLYALLALPFYLLPF